MSESFLPDWRALVREPIVRGLLLSACLHLAVLALVQPAPGAGKPRTVVINARLETSPSESAPEPAPSPAASPEANPATSPPEPAILAGEHPAPVQLPSPPPAPAVAETQAPPRPSTVPAGQPASNPVAASAGPVASPPLPGIPLGIDTTWYVARQVDVQPRAFGRIDPAYPEEARRRNQQGSLKLLLKIDDLGRVRDAEVVEANPPGVFDEAALAAFRQARFQPAMKDGRPVRFQAYMRVDFRLED